MIPPKQLKNEKKILPSTNRPRPTSITSREATSGTDSLKFCTLSRSPLMMAWRWRAIPCPAKYLQGVAVRGGGWRWRPVARLCTLGRRKGTGVLAPLPLLRTTPRRPCPQKHTPRSCSTRACSPMTSSKCWRRLFKGQGKGTTRGLTWPQHRPQQP